MRTPAFALLAILSACVAGGCGKKTDSTTPGGDFGGTPTSIEGVYIVTAFELGGRSLPKSKDEPDDLIAITKDTISQKNVTGKVDVKKYQIDSTKTPAHIDVFETEDGKTKTLYGIYKLEGDTLTLLIAGDLDLKQKDEKGRFKFKSPEAEDRPKEFKGRPDSFDFMITLSRK